MNAVAHFRFPPIKMNRTENWAVCIFTASSKWKTLMAFDNRH